jgi:hypothetical protein
MSIARRLRSTAIKELPKTVWGVCRGRRGYYETFDKDDDKDDVVNFKYYSFDYKKQRALPYATNVSEREVATSKFQQVDFFFNTPQDLAKVVEPMLRDSTIEKGKPFYIPIDVDGEDRQTIVQEGTEPEAGCTRAFIAVKTSLAQKNKNKNKNKNQNKNKNPVVSLWTADTRPVEKDKYLNLKRKAPTCSEVKNEQTGAFMDLVKQEMVASKCEDVFTIDSPLGEAYNTYVKMGFPSEALTVLSRQPLSAKTFRAVANRYSETELSFFFMNAKREKMHFDLDVTQNAETVAAEFLQSMQDGWLFCGQVLRITYSIRKMRGATDVDSVERQFQAAVAQGGFVLDVRCHERYLNENSRPLGFMLAVVSHRA